MNRLLSAKSRIHTTMKRQTLSDRAARTRTFIQAGGLLNLSGLFDICQIEQGDDLQFDTDSQDKAATLLGILLDAVDKIPDPPDAGQMENWRASGTRLLKQRAAQKAYQKMKGRPYS
ncbi:MAG: hypothetical protein K0R52_433 [Alphaproteobacteria bacterium]|jgi:hypothetical protein|nr:hypothetical protein [Alphaproteobacteria bacterium]